MNQLSKKLSALTLMLLIGTMSMANTSNEGIDPVMKKFNKWKKSFVSYPETSTVQSEEGLVKVSFEISDDGSAQNIQIESGISETLDQKAIEMVKNMPKAHLYSNGFIEGTRFILPVKFNLR